MDATAIDMVTRNTQENPPPVNSATIVNTSTSASMQRLLN